MRNWFSTFVKEFRTQLEKLPEEQKNVALKGNDFRAPCQIMIFWLLKPRYLYAMILRDPRIPYDMIKVYGPAFLATMTTEAEKMLGDRWFESLPSPIDTYKEILQPHLLRLIANLPQVTTGMPADVKNKVDVVTRAGEGSTFFEWSIFGNLLGQDPIEFAAKTVADRVTQHERSVTQAKMTSETSTVVASPPTATRPGFLSAFYPPIWLGKPLTFGFREKVEGIYIPPSSKRFRCLYKGRELIISLNGVLTIIEPERPACLGLLNEVMCVALLIGIPSTAVRDQDVAEAMFYENGELGSYSYPLSEQRRVSIQKEFSSISEEEFKTFGQLSDQDLKKIIETAERSTADPTQSDYARWFIDAHSYLAQGNYDHSVVNSWLIIERHSIVLWEDLQRELGKPSKTPPSQYGPPIGRVLSDLLKGNKVSKTEHDILDDFREFRNDMLHNGYHASRERAEEFLATAEDLTRKELGLSRPAS
jgi:hypothetical protein